MFTEEHRHQVRARLIERARLDDHTLALACLRLGLPAAHAKGADRLPAEITAPLREALVRGLDAAELARALGAATRALLGELRESDPRRATDLDKPLLDLAAVS